MSSKSYVLDECLHELFKKEEHRLTTIRNTLVKRNDFLMSSNGHAYILDGEIITYGSYAQNYISNCAPDLEEETRAYIKKYKQYEITKNQVETMLLRCLNASEYLEDWEKLFPSQLHHCLPKCALISSKRESLTLAEINILNKKNVFGKDLIAQIYMKKLLTGE